LAACAAARPALLDAALQPPVLPSDEGQVHYRVFAGPLFAKGGPRAQDPSQNRLGNCGLMASLASLAQAHPEQIAQLIREEPDGTLVVRFFRADRRGELPESLTAQSAGSVEVRINRELPALADGRLAYANRSSSPALWPAYVEKAFAKWLGGYGEVSRGNGANLLFILAGGRSRSFRASALSDSELFDEVARALERKGCVIASTYSAKRLSHLQGALHVQHDHAYSILEARESGGERSFLLRNPGGNNGKPEGRDGEFLCSLADFRQSFEPIEIGCVE
jgi:hypothetical protein